jgi:tRNA-2-methylthio-N6-dimethylallyladenosine synthase
MWGRWSQLHLHAAGAYAKSAVASGVRALAANPPLGAALRHAVGVHRADVVRRNDRILDLMNRNYTREWYMDKVRMIRGILPDCGISCDIISGFCTETEEEHQDTLSLMEWAQFDFSYMYKYSERPGTLAARKYADDIPEETKIRRLQEIIELQNRISREKNQQFIGKEVVVLVEGRSKRSDNDWMGKNDQHIVTIFPKEHYKPGDLVRVRVEKASTTTLIGTATGYAEF